MWKKIVSFSSPQPKLETSVSIGLRINLGNGEMGHSSQFSRYTNNFNDYKKMIDAAEERLLQLAKVGINTNLSVAEFTVTIEANYRDADNQEKKIERFSTKHHFLEDAIAQLNNFREEKFEKYQPSDDTIKHRALVNLHELQNRNLLQNDDEHKEPEVKRKKLGAN